MSDELSVALSLGDLGVKVLAGLGAAVAFLVGYRQYKKGQSWQRSQLVFSLIDSFERNPRIQAACAMLDWDEREVFIGDEGRIKFRNSMLVLALRVPAMDRAGSTQALHEEVVFSKEESLIRDCFDSLFDYFDKLNGFRQNGLLEELDCGYFCYWLELLRGIGKYKHDERLNGVVENYIRKYHFRGVRILLDEYSKHPEPLELENDEPGGC